MLNLSGIVPYLPADLDLMGAMKFIAVFAGAILIVGALVRILLGHNSPLNRSLSAGMGILCIYTLTIMIYTFNPYDLSRFLAPLPFITFDSDVLYLFSFENSSFPEICSQILSMLILAFLSNGLDSMLPRGSSMLSWYISRFVSVILAMVGHYFVSWGFNMFLPGVLVTYAPMILLGILVAMLLIGLTNVVLSLILTVVNPIFGAAYAFFFSNSVGKQLSKAVITTLILCGVVLVLNHLGYAVIAISASALQAYIPLILALLVLWYVVGHIF